MSGAGFSDVRRFTEVDSTNRYVLDQARHGAPEGLVAVADHQSAGRGRRDRRWEAPAGTALLVSVLLRPVLAPDQLHLCTALVALAAADACQRVAAVRPDVKWPNDLVVDGAKLAGVLAEADGSAPGGPPGSTAVVVGVGVNVSWPGPPGVGGTSLLELTGTAVDRDQLLEALVGTVADRRPSLDRSDGRAALSAELAARCATVGQRVRVDLGTSVVTGTAVDLTEDGHLVVETEQGRCEVAAGDVVHLRPAVDG